MPLGKASIQRATGAIEKKRVKSEKTAFSKTCVLTEMSLASIAVAADKAVEPKAALVKSVKKYGIVEPVFALRKGEEAILLCGFARYAAARQAGLEKIPVVLCELTGTGADTALKELQTTKSSKKADTSAEKQTRQGSFSDNIHEEKFKAVNAFHVGAKLPEYLL